MRTRLQFLAGLLGFGALAKAQSRITPPIQPTLPVCVGQDGCIGWHYGKPIDNQCPVCGTIAEPFRRPTITKNDGHEPVPGQPYLVHAVNQREEPYGPTEYDVRCKRCNAKFVQDAE